MDLINFLQTYIDGLWDVTKFLGTGNLQREAMEATMDALPNETSQSVAAPAVLHGDPLSDAALARQMRQLGRADQTQSTLLMPNASLVQSAISHAKQLGLVSVLFVDYGNSCEYIGHHLAHKSSLIVIQADRPWPKPSFNISLQILTA